MFQWKIKCHHQYRSFKLICSPVMLFLGCYVNIRVHSSGPNFHSAKRDPLNESSSYCLSLVKIWWCEIRFIVWQIASVLKNSSNCRYSSVLHFMYISHTVRISVGIGCWCKYNQCLRRDLIAVHTFTATLIFYTCSLWY